MLITGENDGNEDLIKASFGHREDIWHANMGFSTIIEFDTQMSASWPFGLLRALW